MRPYNPDDTVTLEFAVAARALGPREASRLGHVREFMEVSNLGDVLIKTAYLLEDECLACALSAGGVCPDHAV
jgi:hypothetical protein